jgi:hypothetical protein
MICFLVAAISYASWFAQGVGLADCYYNNPDPIAKASCAAEMRKSEWERDFAVVCGAGGLVAVGVAVARRRRDSR